MGRTIGVLSIKGGVGKTSSVVSLGDALSELGKKVLLVDANLSAPNLGPYLNINPEITLHHVLSREANIRDAIYNSYNFDVIPASQSYNSKINPLKLRDKIRHLKRKYDIILLDSSPSLNEETLGVVYASDELIILTTPDLPAINSTLKNIKIAKKRGTPINGIILNKVHNKNFEIPIDDIERISEVPVMAVIPYDISVLKALSQAIPFTLLKPKSEGSKEYKRLAAALIGEKYGPVKLKSFFRWLNPRKQDINRLIFYERVFAES
jgi:MinD-like ATPase involved in chromosome partitioning or flagellar assembly